jgi:two-component system, LuxR family, response regulator FixJ
VFGLFSRPYPKETEMSETDRGKIAIVDDDVGVRDSLRLLLEILGHPAETFGSAAEFLSADLEQFPCLISDHLMPYMTGLELAERLRASRANIPILLITASLSSDLLARAAELGIDRVIEKPASDEHLLDFINATRS